MGTETKKLFLRPPEVKARFGIPEGTLANMRSAKKGPRYFRKPGGRGIFYLLADVEKWITSRPVQTVDSIEA
jgi:predicted DNA-binding transcriptional regulator AlpA